jgi:hypothetical protein
MENNTFRIEGWLPTQTIELQFSEDNGTIHFKANGCEYCLSASRSLQLLEWLYRAADSIYRVSQEENNMNTTYTKDIKQVIDGLSSGKIVRVSNRDELDLARVLRADEGSITIQQGRGPRAKEVTLSLATDMWFTIYEPL